MTAQLGVSKKTLYYVYYVFMSMEIWNIYIINSSIQNILR